MQLKKRLTPILFLLVAFTATAQSRHPFASFGDKAEVVTLTNGKYEEFFDEDSIQRIGTVWVNINTMQVVKLGLTKQQQQWFDNTGDSRFLSVDPLTAKYAELTPYQYASNRPIDGVDEDGLEFAPSKDKQGNVTGYNWVGYNKDGTAKTGSVPFAILNKSYGTFWYSSNSSTHSGTIHFFSNTSGASSTPTSGSSTHDATYDYNYTINFNEKIVLGEGHAPAIGYDVSAVANKPFAYGFRTAETEVDAAGYPSDPNGYGDRQALQKASMTFGFWPKSEALQAPPINAEDFVLLPLFIKDGLIAAGKYIFKDADLFALRGGYGVFGEQGLKIGNYKVEAMYANPAAGSGAGTILSIKQLKAGGALFRWDYGLVHGTQEMAMHSTIRFYWNGVKYGNSAQRTWYPSMWKAPFFKPLKP